MYNTTSKYGWIAVFLHWFSVLVIFSMFSLGLWMTGLDYYDSWYKKGPDLHRAIGVLFFLLLLLRLFWRRINVEPSAEASISVKQNVIAHRVHQLLYLLLLLMICTGYLISTADGRSVEVFGLFSIPALISDLPNQEDIAGAIHWYLALMLMSFVLLHAAAAFKHHFVDKDRTLLKMLGR